MTSNPPAEQRQPGPLDTEHPTLDFPQPRKRRLADVDWLVTSSRHKKSRMFWSTARVEIKPLKTKRFRGFTYNTPTMHEVKPAGPPGDG